MLGIDELGLDTLDRRILTILVDRFDGGPVGLDTLAAALGEDPDTLGFIRRTPQGRVASERAYAHLGRTPTRLL